MSHYTVAVFHRKGQSVDELLEPYDENKEVAPYIRFTRQEAIGFAREQYVTEGKTDEECWRMVADDSKTDEDGNIYSTYNPNSKWDWYCEGGRWGGMLKDKRGRSVNSGRVKNIVFPFDEDVYAAALRFWDVAIDHKKPEDGEDYAPLYKEEYYRDYYGDRETYARHQAQFSTFAVITPDGEWHEKGQMGWFGCSGETPDEAKDWEENYKARFLDSADPDWYVTIVDCHI